MCEGTPRATGSFRFGDGETYERWQGYLWAPGPDGGAFGKEFFPEGKPGLRRLNEEETGRAWKLFREAAERRAADKNGCCYGLAEEVMKLLAEPAPKENAK